MSSGELEIRLRLKRKKTIGGTDCYKGYNRRESTLRGPGSMSFKNSLENSKGNYNIVHISMHRIFCPPIMTPGTSISLKGYIPCCNLGLINSEYFLDNHH
jgi:hypothetical protein